MNFSWLKQTFIFVLVTSSIAGCGPSSFTNPPVQNELGVQKVRPSGQFDAVKVTDKVYEDIDVYSADGKRVHLDVKNQPILFGAYWCPHCQRVMLSLFQHREQLHTFPILVSVGFAPGTSLSTAVEIVRKEFAILHIKDIQVYYSIDRNKELGWVAGGLPTLAFPFHGQILSLTGEHTIEVYKRAINQQKNE